MKTFSREATPVVSSSSRNGAPAGALRRASALGARLFVGLSALALAGGCARGIENRDGGVTRPDVRTPDVSPTPDAPMTGTCTDGEEQPCYSGAASTRGVGACADGTQRCEGERFGACEGQTVPVREVCGNSVDDDCDGMADEDCGDCMPGMTRACYTGSSATMGVGACRGGMQSCGTDMAWGECLGEVTPRAMELCTNSVDDDCNGMVDDGCGECTAGEVRSCYSGAMATQGRGRCVAGSQVCTPTRTWSTTCMGEVVPAPMEVCTNGIDDDCNGMTDEGCGDCMPGSTRACYTGPMTTMGVGVCRSGTQSCGTTRTWPTTCPGEVRPAASETCGNGADDNCNGMADEGCPACSPPPNQTCATASALTIGGAIMGNSQCSMAMVASSCGRGEGAEVAYRFTTDGSANAYTFRMAPGTLRDPVLHLHAASACASVDEIACNDDETGGSGLGSAIDIGSLPAGTYYLVADGRDPSDRGTFTLSSSVRAINNDTCGNAIPITRNGVFRGATTGKADNYSPSTSCSPDNLAPDVVYTIRPVRATRVTLTTAGSNFDTVLYVGTTCGGSQQACNDDSGGTTSSVSWDAAANTTYYVTIDGYLSRSGSYVLNVTGL